MTSKRRRPLIEEVERDKGDVAADGEQQDQVTSTESVSTSASKVDQRSISSTLSPSKRHFGGKLEVGLTLKPQGHSLLLNNDSITSLPPPPTARKYLTLVALLFVYC